jgi:hypothetical protein
MVNAKNADVIGCFCSLTSGAVLKLFDLIVVLKNVVVHRRCRPGSIRITGLFAFRAGLSRFALSVFEGFSESEKAFRQEIDSVNVGAVSVLCGLSELGFCDLEFIHRLLLLL